MVRFFHLTGSVGSGRVWFGPFKPDSGWSRGNKGGSEGRAFFRGSERIRFWGVNICSDAAFPETHLATGIARQLAAMGFNGVRFHHIDASWPHRNIFGERPQANTRSLDAESMARLDDLINALQQEGMYINLNLLVSRRFTSADGLPAVFHNLSWKQIHTIGFWDERIEYLQKEYARQLLWHVNPHSGRRYSDDPGVFMVEIINENSLSQAF